MSDAEDAQAAAERAAGWLDPGEIGMHDRSGDPDYSERDEDDPQAHDCPREQFLDDPITVAYGVGQEMLHLISCPVCDAIERDQDEAAWEQRTHDRNV